MKRYDVIYCAAATAVLVGCGGGLNIRTDFDPQANFGGFDTYAWAERTETGDTDPRVYNAITAGRVKTAVNRALQAKGFREASSNPDFIVAWHGAIEGKMSTTTINDHYGYGTGWYGRYGGVGMGTTTSRTYQNEWDEGTLMIDIIDTRNNQLVWRGVAQAKLNDRPPSPEEAQRRADDAAVKILESFPPGGGSE